MVQTQFNSKIIALRSYFKHNSIIHHSSCVNTLQQNGIVERKNWHLLEVTITIMFQSNVPKHFWGKTILAVTFLINRRPSRVLGFLTPIHVFSQAFPHNHLVSDIPLRVFGCISFVHVHSQNRTKWMLRH